MLEDSGCELLCSARSGSTPSPALEPFPPGLRTIVSIGDAPATLAGRARIVAFGDLDGEPVDATVGPLDPIAIMYTSGTTGASKGVVLCHRYFLLVGHANAANMGLGALMTRISRALPLFHGMAQLSGTMAPLLAGSDIVLVRRFSVSAFWETCRGHGVTAFGAIAAMTSMLHGAPPTSRDREHAVRYAFAVAVPESLHRPFEERFGVRLVNGYGLTEGSMLTYCPYDDLAPQCWCARPALRGGDPRRARPTGRRRRGGRDRLPSAHARRRHEAGHHARPDATVEAWRNLWLHTGDLGRFDADGFLTFVDRGKDAIRRRGENISSFEVESAVARLAGVGEVAAYAVPSSLGEDEVMLAVVRSDPTLTPEALHAACAGVLPRFSLPAYVRFLDRMPYTPTNKIRKVDLRHEGVTDDTWAAP